MKTINTNYWIFILVFCLISCNRDRFKIGQFPEEPVNLQLVNSAMDDINSDIPFVSHTIQLVFSTNRGNAQTRDFNLTLSYLDFNWDKSDGILTVNQSNNLFDSEFESFRDMVRRTESPANEKGPYSINDGTQEKLLLFSREVEGVYSIFFEPEFIDFSGRTLKNIRIMDESANEMYPSFYGENFVKGMETTNARPEMMLFTSDKDGQFDIYEADIAADQSVLHFLLNGNPKTI